MLSTNSLSVSLGWLADRQVGLPQSTEWFVSLDSNGWHYQSGWITVSILISLAMLAVLWRRAHRPPRRLQKLNWPKQQAQAAPQACCRGAVKCSRSIERRSVVIMKIRLTSWVNVWDRVLSEAE